MSDLRKRSKKKVGNSKKQLIIETLDKVEREALPLFIQNLKMNTFVRLALGKLSKETADELLETCEEYLAAAQNKESKQ